MQMISVLCRPIEMLINSLLATTAIAKFLTITLVCIVNAIIMLKFSNIPEYRYYWHTAF